MATTAVFELEVADTFHFTDGRTVFVGPVQSETQYIPPGQAELVVNGQVVAVIELEGEMIPSSRHPLGYRSVSTTDSADLGPLSPSDAEVRLRIHSTT